jgi:hypothetical protein
MRITRLLSSVLIVSMLPALVQATVVVPADLGELARDARAIVVGRVAAVDGRWTDDRRTIETIITLDVETYLKGSFGSTLQFRVPGGVLGRYRNIVVGAPEFVANQHVIVFLGARGPMIPYIVGFNQGVYRVVRGEDGEWSVTPPAPLPAAATTRVTRGDPSRQPLALIDFESRVRALARAAQ